MKYCTINLKI
ncbi:hypothetical protein BpHYR1_043835 [Brachionus plicatilis]|uniref:Uncharacterized protein n=1 Tax=Brachionus plicatilis TaxID=10195 RepID=A0A3M7RWQ8_BRAPC|nr:hypothetical protein BpHYR1_043835 [Brachionus plicatilis]